MAQDKPITSICYVAGHSGGHIIPCLTLAKQIKQAQPHTSILFFSSDGNVDTTILAGNDIIDHHIPLSLSHKRSFINVPFIAVHLAFATLKSFYILLRHKPSRIASTGGIIAIPVCLAAWLLRIPIDLYELNAVPGKAIKLIAPISTTLYVCFSSTQRYFPRIKSILTEYPIRFANKDSNNPIASFSPQRITLFVQGGSQGSHYINQQIKQLIASYPVLQNSIQIIHQTGADTSIDWHTFYQQYGIPAVTFAYEHEVAPYYHHADLIISRAGAGALFETAHFKKQCLMIPLETRHNTHQLDNARAMAAEHPELFTLIRQQDDVVKKLYEVIKHSISRIRKLKLRK